MFAGRLQYKGTSCWNSPKDELLWQQGEEQRSRNMHRAKARLPDRAQPVGTTLTLTAGTMVSQPVIQTFQVTLIYSFCTIQPVSVCSEKLFLNL